MKKLFKALVDNISYIGLGHISRKVWSILTHDDSNFNVVLYTYWKSHNNMQAIFRENIPLSVCSRKVVAFYHKNFSYGYTLPKILWFNTLTVYFK